MISEDRAAAEEVERLSDYGIKQCSEERGPSP